MLNVRKSLFPYILSAMMGLLPSAVTKDSRSRASQLITDAVEKGLADQAQTILGQQLAEDIAEEAVDEMLADNQALEHVAQALDQFDTVITEPSDVTNAGLDSTDAVSPEPVAEKMSPASTPTAADIPDLKKPPVYDAATEPGQTPQNETQIAGDSVASPDAPEETTSNEQRREPTPLADATTAAAPDAAELAPSTSLDADESSDKSSTTPPNESQTKPATADTPTDPAPTSPTEIPDVEGSPAGTEDALPATPAPYEAFPEASPQSTEGQFPGTDTQGGTLGAQGKAETSAGPADASGDMAAPNKAPLKQPGKATAGVNKLRFWRDIQSINKEIKELQKRKRPIDKERKHLKRQYRRYQIAITGLKLTIAALRLVERLIYILGFLVFITIFFFEIGLFIWGWAAPVRTVIVGIKTDIFGIKRLMVPIRKKLRTVDATWLNIVKRIRLLAKRRNDLNNAGIAGAPPTSIP